MASLPWEKVVFSKSSSYPHRQYAQHHIPAPTREEALKASGGKRQPLPVVITCFDARVVPEQFFNLKVGGL